MRAQWLQRISKLVTQIHPKAVISYSVIIGEGHIVEAGAVIYTDVKICKGIIMANAVVDHNVVVGDCCQLKYNYTIPENCVMPNNAKVDCYVVYRYSVRIESLNK